MFDYTQDFKLRGVPVSATEMAIEMQILLVRCRLRVQKEKDLLRYMYGCTYMYPSYVCMTTSKLSEMRMVVPKALSVRIARETLDFIKREKDISIPYILRMGVTVNGTDIRTEDDIITVIDKRLRFRGIVDMMTPFMHISPNASLQNDACKRRRLWDDVNTRWNEHIDAMVREALTKSRLPNTFIEYYRKNKNIMTRRRILGFSKFYKVASQHVSTKS